MSGILVAMQGAVAQGVLWGIMVLGVYITYRLLDIADLTVDGSFALGGCVCATLIINFDLDPLAALLLSMLAGMAAGAVTGILHTVLEIPAILAGILTQISLWSINLRIMSGKSNLPLLKLKTLISSVGDSLGITQAQASILVGVAAAVLIVAVLYWFFGTEIGSALRATGNNEDMIRALGVNVKRMKLLGLMLSNGLVGLSGALVCQHQKYADINMGRGAIVIGLAAVIIGEAVFGRIFHNFALKMVSVSLGAIIYYIVIQLVLTLGFDANLLKLLSASVVAVFLAVPYWKGRYFAKPAAKKANKEGANNA